FNDKLSYFFNTLYSRGYLTESKESGEYITSPLSSPEISLCVPNLGIKEYLRVECVKWFKEKLINFDYENLLTAFWQGSNQKFADILHNILDTSMNFYNYEEAFYPVFLIELFAYAGCKVELYVEKETGKPHILVKDLESDPPRAAFIEVKYEPEEELDLKKTAKKALVYIALHKLQEAINLEEFEIIRWGVAFYEKRCAAKSQIVSRDYF
ncbi:MAG: PD-(D/E)XK nuclease domain-containing protein, partial [Desulfovibrionaceae bacterium]|nr:PD-(D/E)XK nuclease domain-containing protein [Desulfovibrionaceae bacterium]